ncbi:MAG: hypothetical protein ACJ748_05235 [Flavisolibacter sp.]
MIKYSIASVLISILVISCKKEISNEKADIQGNYKFISITAHTKSTTRTTSGTDVSEATTYSDYITQNNTGTVKIDGSTMTSQNLSYSIDTIMTSIVTTNGTSDTIQMPFQVTVPPSSGTAAYQSISADSIYCPSGTIFMSGTTQAAIPSGARIKLDGDKLYMTVHGIQTATQTVQGETVYVYADVNGTVTLQKM